MITINAAFGQEEKVLGTLGRIGENETRQIVFDCSDILTEYPGAEIVCVMQRHCDRIAYLAAAVLDGNALTVTLTDADVSAPGDLRIELRALTDGKIRKSAVYMGQVVSALRGEQDKPGNPTADVLNRIDMTISRAEKSIADADAAAKSAQTVADIVQAKLDNGDFVGPAGKPGSDASVTADNIQAALGYTPVKDVRLNGESLVQDSAATIPLAGYNRLGAVQLDPAGFAAASVEGKLALVPPTDAQISTHTYTQRPITPSCMDYAVKAAMCDGIGAAWTAEEQVAARDRMNAQGSYKHIATITIDEDGVYNVGIDRDENGMVFSVSDVYIYGYIKNTGGSSHTAIAINTITTTVNGSNNIIRLSYNYQSNGAQFEANIKKSKYWRAYTVSSIGVSDPYISGATGYTSVSHRGASNVRKNEWETLTALAFAVDGTAFGIGTTFDIWGR